MVRLRMLVTYDASDPCFQVAPSSEETSTFVRVATAIIFSLDCTATKSVLPITGPPLQLWPLLVLVKRPELVAANQALGVTSMSFTFASRTERTAVLVATEVFLVPFFTTRVEAFSVTMVLIGFQILLFFSSIKMPRLVPARRAPLLACSSANTSRPPRPALFWVQCWPPSCEAKTPPHSRSFTTPTRMVFGSVLSATIAVT